MAANKTIRTREGEAPRVRTASGEVVVLDAAEYEALVAAAEDAADTRAAAEAASDETLPWRTYKRLGAGESPVRVWRAHRGLKGKDLAAAAEISQAYLSDIERGRREGSLRVVARLARALGVQVDDLVPANIDEIEPAS